MDAVEKFVEVDGLKLHVRQWGESERPLLVLLHGLASTSHMFDLVAPDLAKTHHVVAFDQRGHGLSDKPATGYDFESLSVDLDNVVQALGFGDASFALGGHSWGASTALYYAATRPERITKAILLDGGLRPTRDRFPSVSDMAPPQRTDRPLSEIKRMIREDWLGSAWRPELEPLVLSIYDISDPADLQPHLKLANHMQIAQSLWDFRPTDYFSQVKSPLLIVGAFREGQQPDRQIVAYAKEAQKLTSHCECVWMLNTIHDIPWQRPQELAETIRRFLAR